MKLASPLFPSSFRALLASLLTAWAAGTCLMACGGSSGSSGSGSATLTNDLTLSPATGATLSNATQNELYQQRFTVSSGGTSPYSFNEITDGLPEGLFLVMTDSSGLGLTSSTYGDVVGFPQTTGSDTVEFRVVDSDNLATDSSYDLTTVAASTSTALTLSPSTGTHLSSGVVGVAYNTVSLTIGNGTPSYGWSVVYGSLPPGLTLNVDPSGTNSAEAQIGGIPTTSGTYIFAIAVQDGASTANKGGSVYQITVQ